ncbi:MAG: hypothetical protein FWG61_07895 [Firmicutes bacterium]|nr:hypothetical protein [Bacillota bacterium]
MRNGIFPVFTKGRVLKRESIEYLRDFPHDLVSLAKENYADGVLFGFTVSREDETIIVSKGALKYHGIIIIVPENTILIEEYEQLLHIKLVIGEYSRTDDYLICPIEVRIEKKEAQAENEIELGRFCLNPGAALRCEYDSFRDLRTPENTLDLTHVSYAGSVSPTLHPRIMHEYAREVLAFSTDALDISFALMCINAGIVHKKTIQWYIAMKTHKPYEDYTLTLLYEKLEGMLPQHGLKEKAKRPRGKGPIID